MVEKVGELARSYWPVVAGVVGAAVAWGALYEQGRQSAATLERMVAVVQRIDVTAGATAEHVRVSDQTTADLLARVRTLEDRGWPRR